jgi:hypothetical protein
MMRMIHERRGRAMMSPLSRWAKNAETIYSLARYPDPGN